MVDMEDAENVLPTSCVLDTSVLVKWFRQGEVLGDHALGLRKAYLDGQILIALPTLAAYELANVLRYKKDLEDNQVQDAMVSLYDMDLDWISPSVDLLKRAIEIARSYNTTVYDAIFVALAETIGGVSITADARLARRLERLPSMRFLGEIQIQ